MIQSTTPTVSGPRVMASASEMVGNPATTPPRSAAGRAGAIVSPSTALASAAATARSASSASGPGVSTMAMIASGSGEPARDPSVTSTGPDSRAIATGASIATVDMP